MKYVFIFFVSQIQNTKKKCPETKLILRKICQKLKMI